MPLNNANKVFRFRQEKGNFFSINSIGQLHAFLCERKKKKQNKIKQNKTKQNSEQKKERNDVVMKR